MDVEYDGIFCKQVFHLIHATKDSYFEAPLEVFEILESTGKIDSTDFITVDRLSGAMRVNGFRIVKGVSGLEFIEWAIKKVATVMQKCRAMRNSAEPFIQQLLFKIWKF